MPLGEDLVTYLAAIPALGLTAGTNAFWVPFPEAANETDQAVCYIETPGMVDVHAAGASLSLPLAETARFQIVCRDAEDQADACQTLARAIRRKVNRLAGVTIGSTRVLLIKSLTRPFYLSTDNANRHRFVTNYEATIEDVGA
jgi:hypothetical protein